MPLDAGASGGKQYTLQPISIEGFEGPLDLLLSLIEEGAFDVSRISLAAVTDQYLLRLQALRDLPPEHLADFLVVAATLLLLKSKRLFPELPLTNEEEERVVSLEEQLREYRRFREAAKQLLQLWNERRILYAREAFQGIAPVFYPPSPFGRAELQQAIGAVIGNLPRVDITAEEVVQRVISLEELAQNLQARIATQPTLTFREVARAQRSKINIIVAFLALLQLVKDRVLTAEQRGEFHDILIQRRTDAP